MGWDQRATTEGSWRETQGKAWKTRQQAFKKHGKGFVKSEDRTGGCSSRNGWLRGVAAGSTGQRKRARKADLGRKARGQRTGRKFDTERYSGGFGNGMGNEHGMSIIRVDGSSLRPNHCKNHSRRTVGATKSNATTTIPCKLPNVIFKDRKQRWNLSRDAKRILGACIVSDKSLFLTKCEERLGAWNG